MWPLIISGFCMLLFFVIIIGRNKGFGNVIERLAVLWFKLAGAIVILFIANVIVSNYGFTIPINLFSTLTIAFLGLPGMLCIGILVVFNK